MPGEHPDSPYPEDAEHWVRVYEQLLQGAEALLVAGWSPEGAGAPDELRTRAARYRRRLRYWKRRAELAGPGRK
ncbi:MAG: hypothetical protein ACREPI_00390 [Candidatus Dormibacterales bacterium]